MATVAVLGTCDTKLEELLYLKTRLQVHGATALLMDVGRSATMHPCIDMTQPTLLSQGQGHGHDQADPSSLSRSEAIKLMSSLATTAIARLFHEGRIHALLAAGGSGGTALAAPVLSAAVPFGFPKLMVSTVASGDTGPYVGEADVAMLYPVVDVAGLNQVLRDVLDNAAAMMAGAARAYHGRKSAAAQGQAQGRRVTRVGITMFGVTTPGVDAARRHLTNRYDVETYIFHATGHGGKAMERMVREGCLDAVLDLTTTELCDHVVPGGTMSAGPGRLDAAIEARIPNILSLGATDMVNFGPPETVPERYREGGRKLHEHNPVVTLMRTDEHEVRRVGEFIVKKLKDGPRKDLVQVWIPKGGISAMATPSGPFEDGEADEVLFQTLRNGLHGSGIKVVEDERDVNNEGFARDIADELMRLVGQSCSMSI